MNWILFNRWLENLYGRFIFPVFFKYEHLDYKTGRITNRITRKSRTFELSPMSRLGVTFTEEQGKLIRELVEKGNIMDAQKMILDNLALELGDGKNDAFI